MIRSLERQFAALEDGKKDLLRSIEATSPAQAAYRASADSWNVAEVVDHLVRVERAVLAGASKPGVRRERWRSKPVRRFLVWATFRLGIRIPIPRGLEAVSPEREVALSEAVARWENVRAEWRVFLARISPDQLGQLAVKHPIAGPLGYHNVLNFLIWHQRHHRRQIARVLRAAS